MARAHDHAEQQLRDPASVRRQLERAERAHDGSRVLRTFTMIGLARFIPRFGSLEKALAQDPPPSIKGTQTTGRRRAEPAQE